MLLKSIRSKQVITKADNAMGVVVSMSGYSSVAIQEASRDKTRCRCLTIDICIYCSPGRYVFPMLLCGSDTTALKRASVSRCRRLRQVKACAARCD